MWMLGNHPKGSLSVDVDFLYLCKQNVYSVADLVNGGNLLNRRQCQDLSFKLSKSIQSITDLKLRYGESAAFFQSALENLYQYLEKAKLLVAKCGEEDWCAAAVFQIQNENAFRDILLDVSLCYSAIYEQARCISEHWNDPPEDLRLSSIFQPTIESDVHEDQLDAQKRLEDLANEPGSVKFLGHFLPTRGFLRQCLARYLLAKMHSTSLVPHASSLDTYSGVLWKKESAPTRTWGNYMLLGAGSGASGVCSTKWLGIPCAKKEFHQQEAESSFLKEAGILAHLKHPNIVNFLCCGNGQERGDRFIAMELMEKSLSNLIDDQKDTYFSLPVVVDIIIQIARGMCYLHDRGVAHRDLKPQNVVVNRLTSPYLGNHFLVKLVDFGMSKTKVQISKSSTISLPGVGTTRYRAPEVHPKAYPNGKGKTMWFKADVFSFAMTCAHLLSLQLPFKDLDQISELFSELMKGLRPQLPSNCPQELVSLLQDCWGISPRSRPSFVEICTRLETFRHKFLREIYFVDKETMDFSSGFSFIKLKIEEHSSMSRPFVDIGNDELEIEPPNDFHGNKRSDVVSVIPCTLNHALKLLPEAPYKNGLSSSCNICKEEVNGEAYRCEVCNFDAHPDCAEIKNKVKVFIHDDPLHLLIYNYYENNPDAMCRFCEESLQGSAWVYRCEQCDFDVHALCTKYPKRMKHLLHSHPLILIHYPPRKNRLGKCCNGHLKGYRYTCTQKWCVFDVHPQCAIAAPMHPLCIFNSSHRLSLKCGSSRGFHCSRCGYPGSSWFYYCDHCDKELHVNCVLPDAREEGDGWNEDKDKQKIEQVQLKVREGPRTCLFFKWRLDTQPKKLLTTLRADMEGVRMVLLCEEPGHEHVVHGDQGGVFNGLLGEQRLEKLQLLLPYGLQVVKRAVSMATELNDFSSVTLPCLGTGSWNLKVISDIRNQSKEPIEDKETMSSALESLLNEVEGHGFSMLKLFGLLRVRYIATEVGEFPRYTKGMFGWLCIDHLNRGIETGKLESYPLRMYHDLTIDQQRQFR
ncbi:hypothetical protein KC19_3G137200 [Ceratodon purpureus]|uniref:Protein kinase domain-containing protein n=1 Tax=Ceratodon purpureus TaxID=3225 RepID=A0A8T0II32_CERPU|nr:hypothetical protein KC19_3G137200 [Ceratodon purpureus]